MANFYLDICLSDIPKERIKRANNGKSYVKLNIGERRTADEKGYDHYVSVYVPKEERHEGDRTIYVGSGKLREQRAENSPRSENSPRRESNTDGLPF